jgi:hypothetical protein
MSVDNNAILFVGRDINDVNLLELDSITKQDIIDLKNGNVCIVDILDKLSGIDWFEYTYNGNYLIGFCAGDSGSYDCKEYKNLNEFCDLILDLKRKFIDMFNVEPHVYLFNFQW